MNSPWGLALAPANFGRFSNALLVGNFGDGRINAFHPHSGAFLGTLSDTDGNAIQTDGLWAIRFAGGDQRGSGKKHGDDGDDDDDDDEGGNNNAVLYFTAGPDDEAHGLIGKIVAGRGRH